MLTWYNTSQEERDRCGALGREYCLEEGYTAEGMGQAFIEGMDGAFEEWDKGTRPPRVRLVKAI